MEKIISPDPHYEIQVFENIPNSCYHWGFSRFFFHEPEHIVQQSNQAFYTFYLIHRRKNKLEARYTFFEVGALAQSPLRAPFGSIDLNPQVPIKTLLFFLDTIEQFVLGKKMHSLRIKSYPEVYAPESAQVLRYALGRLGYEIVYDELNYHLPISPMNLENQMHHSSQRRLRKCIQAGFQFLAYSATDLPSVYEFIQANRDRKGFPMSLTYQAFEDLFERFPQRFLIFQVVSPSNEWAALAVVVIINKRVLYHFYPADAEKYLNFSPVIMLNEGLYTYARQQGFQILDLGTATVQGEPNDGLIRFKKNLGALASLKTVFQKKISPNL